MSRCRGHNLSGRRFALTLLEVILAVSIIIIMMSVMLTFMWRTLQIREQVIADADHAQIARLFLEKISDELRGVLGGEELNFPVEQRLLGTRRSIEFLTTEMPERTQFTFYSETDEQPPARHDVQWVSYSLWVDENETTEDGDPMVGGILRTLRRTLSQTIVDEEEPLQQRSDNWAPELGFLEFRYFDGVEWHTEWQLTEGNSLPQMIMITVGYDNITMPEWEDYDLDDYPIEDYPLGPDEPFSVDRYSVLVRLPAADRFFSSRLQTLGQSMTEDFGVEGLEQ
jgi:hypothetical protein